MKTARPTCLVVLALAASGASAAGPMAAAPKAGGRVMTVPGRAAAVPAGGPSFGVGSVVNGMIQLAPAADPAGLAGLALPGSPIEGARALSQPGALQAAPGLAGSGVSRGELSLGSARASVQGVLSEETVAEGLRGGVRYGAGFFDQSRAFDGEVSAADVGAADRGGLQGAYGLSASHEVDGGDYGAVGVIASPESGRVAAWTAAFTAPTAGADSAGDALSAAFTGPVERILMSLGAGRMTLRLAPEPRAADLGAEEGGTSAAAARTAGDAAVDVWVRDMGFVTAAGVIASEGLLGDYAPVVDPADLSAGDRPFEASSVSGRAVVGAPWAQPAGGAASSSLVSGVSLSTPRAAVPAIAALWIAAIALIAAGSTRRTARA